MNGSVEDAKATSEHVRPNGLGTTLPIAVIGMACRLPGDVSNLNDFWEFCLAARNSWTEIPKDRWNTSALYHPDPEKSGSLHIEGAHFLQESVAAFDAPFFNITASEAESMDPRHRILLECTYEALENGGIPISSIAGHDTGVFVGGTLSHYELQCLRDPPTLPRLHYMGCADSLLANRISYFFDLHGPSVTLDTACSSGLTALHVACQNLGTGQISQAIVGGCHLNLMPEMLASTSSAMFYSADGRCYPFDERVSGGFGPGEGASCVILKPLQDAIDAGDCVRAIIRGTGMNQDGRTAGISLPSSEAQARLVRNVYSSAGLDPSDTKFIEAHGTGTTAGDPLEAAAFATTIAERATLGDPTYIGSAKSNFGHLEGVSGIVSLIKAALMLEHQVILPNANFKNPNPKISSLGVQLRVPQNPEKWQSTGARRVSINNLGFGGANAHAILEEAPHMSHTPGAAQLTDGPPLQDGNGHIETLHALDNEYLFLITAYDEPTVKRQMVALKLYLTKRKDQSKDLSLRDLAFTLGQRRSLLLWKFAVVASTADELMTRLETPGKSAMRSSKAPNLGFVFTGQGANWQGMGRELFQMYPVFSSTMELADEFLTSLGASWSLKEELFDDTENSLFQQAQFSQPACTAIQLALVRLLESFDIRPHSVTGHSSGEIGAAFAAGALTFETCLLIAYQRGIAAETLKQRYPDMKGAMLALGAGPAIATTMLEDVEGNKAVIACINSPTSVTLSGEVEAILKLQAAADEKKIFARILNVDTAYHSPHMDLVADDYKAAIGKIKPTSSRNVHFYSSLTGAKVSTLALGTSYWVNNLKSPVLFATSLSACCSLNQKQPTTESAITHLIEIGPHSALKGPVRDILVAAPTMTWKIRYSSTLVRKENAVRSILNLTSELTMQGCKFNMMAINFPRGRGQTKVLSDLSPYPWNHETEYWHESRITHSHRLKSRPRSDLLGTMVPESNDLEPWWRNVLRIDDIPWLRHHKIRSNAVFPFAGYVSMVVEASIQRAASRNIVPSVIDFQEIYNSQPLILLEGIDTEIMLTLRPLGENPKTSSDIWDEFRIFSWTEDSGWAEHCRGQVAAISRSKASTANQVCGSTTVMSSLRDHISTVESACVADIDSGRIYDDARKVGIEYGPCMTMLSDCRAGDGKAMATVRVPDTASTMPYQSESRLVVHPALLDNCIHIAWPLLGAGLTGVDGLFLPAFVNSISVQLGPRSQSGDVVKVYGTASGAAQPFERVIESVVVMDPTQSEELPTVAITGMVFAFLSDTQVTREKLKQTAYSRMHWEPCVDLLEPEEFQSYFASADPYTDEMAEVKDLERASLYYIDSALKEVGQSNFQSLQHHHQKLYRLMQKQLHAAKDRKNPLLDAHWDTLNDAERDRFLASVREGGPSGELTCKVGESLPLILLNVTDPLSIMFADGLLERYYRHSRPLSRSNEHTAHLLSSLAHENPNMRILEIGAGTGGTTLPILDRLGGTSGRPPRFQDYVFSDISNAFFEKAQDMFKEWVPLVTFQTLNIEKDPLSQNLEPESFDLIVAAQVLHATAQISRTLHHVRKLLKPGGRLVLVEATSVKAQLFPFATLPGWWLRETEDELKAVKDLLLLQRLGDEYVGNEEFRTDGPLLTEFQWDRILKQSGFSGVDRSLHDYPGELVHSNSVLVSTVSVEDVPRTGRDLIIIQSRESSRYSVEELKDTFRALHPGSSARVSSLSEVAHMDLKDNICIYLDELDSPMLAKVSGEGYRAIRNVCTAACTLWVVEGAQTESPPNPESGMAIGLARCVRSENPAIRLVTLDLDATTRLPPSRTSEIIARVCQAVLIQDGSSKQRSAAHESEYLERNGVLHIPRVIPDLAMEQCVQELIKDPVPRPQSSFDGCPALSLRIGTLGLLDSFYFDHDEALDGPIQPGAVEIQIRASSLNFRDVIIALGKIPEDSLGLDCAGVISAVGSSVLDLAVGDRVCAISPGAFGTVMRCAASCAVQIPKDTRFEVAASLPVVCTTVYHSLINVAGLRKGETILIHAAAGGVGQNAIMLSQSMGVEVFATVGNAQKKNLLMTKFEIPENHIFYSRDTSFEDGIRSMTQGRGVDVALSASSGDLRRATWRCLAHFGRYVDIGKADFLANNRLDMEPFLHNRVYAAVDVRSLASERPLLMKDLLLNVIDLHIRGVFKPLEQLEVYPYSRIEAAFRRMQGGENVGKIVLVPEIREPVKIMPPKVTMSSIHADATYLITGGSGGLAISFAAWLAHHGAKNIALISRSGIADSKTSSLIQDWQKRGVAIVLARCDVTDPGQVDMLVRQDLSHMPQVKGVIHGANVSRSVLFEQSTVEDFLAVVRPKVQGAWNLHNTLLNNDLEFFLSIASVTGIFGNQGQSAYCATTTFLEAFAAYRVSLGLAATTINLGPVIEVGFLTKQSVQMRNQVTDVMGCEVSEEELLAIMDIAISGNMNKESHYCSIAGLKCTGSSTQSFWSQTPMFANMRIRKSSGQKEEAGAAIDKQSVRRQLAGAETLAEARRLIYDSLAVKMSTVLMVEEEDLRPDRALASYGSDSLVAVEIRNWIRREMEATVILMDILADNTLTTLTESVISASKLCERFF